MITQLTVPERHSEPYHPAAFHDAYCPLCRSAIALQRRVDRAERLRWVAAVGEPGILARHAPLWRTPWLICICWTARDAGNGAGQCRLGLLAGVAGIPTAGKTATVLGLRDPLGFAWRHFAAWRYRRRCGSRPALAARYSLHRTVLPFATDRRNPVPLLARTGEHGNKSNH